MPKICYIVTIPTTIEAFFIPQLKHLAENGFDVSVVCSGNDTLQEKLGERITYHPIEIPRGLTFWGSIKAIRNLLHYFKQERFDLIQYSTPNAAFYASIAAKMAGCKVRNYHLMGLRYLGASGIGYFILKIIEKIACDNSSSIECVSKSNMELGIREKLFSPDKVTVVWNGSTGGVDLSKFDFSQREQWRNEIRNELGYSNSDFIYGFAGRINRDKGINELLTSYLRLNTDAKLLLIGQMENIELLDTELLESARRNPNIQFHNVVTDIERYFAAMDVLVLPSYREGFGNVVIEAGAMGTPAIVSNISGPIDAIEVEETAFVVQTKDVNSLEYAMRKIQNIDYRKMGRNASRYVKEKFNSEILCEKIFERKKLLVDSSCDDENYDK